MAAIEELKLDRLYIVPAAQSPFKPEQKPVNAACENYESVGWVTNKASGKHSKLFLEEVGTVQISEVEVLHS